MTFATRCFLLPLLLLIWVALPGVQSVQGQAKCGATSGGDWTEATWQEDSDDDGNFDDGACPVSDNGNGNYPDGGDEAVILPDVRITLDIDLDDKTGGEGSLASLDLKSGSSTDASGTALFFGVFTGGDHDLATTGDVSNFSGGTNNGLLITSGAGTGSLTIGGRLVNSGTLEGDNPDVQLFVEGQLDNNSGASTDLAGADTVSISNGIQNDGGIDFSDLLGVSVTGSNIRNAGNLDISNGRLTVGTNSSLTENGTFTAANSIVIFNGTDQTLSGNATGGDGTPDITFHTLKLRDATLVDPSQDVRVNQKFDVETESQWGSGDSETSNFTFSGPQFSVNQNDQNESLDAQFFSNSIVFDGSDLESDETTTVAGEVFSEVIANTKLILSEEFIIGGRTIIRGVTIDAGTNRLQFNDDTENNGTIDVDGTLAFAGEGNPTSGLLDPDGDIKCCKDNTQDLRGTGTFELDGLEILSAGTTVQFAPNISAPIETETLFSEADTELQIAGNLNVTGNLTSNGILKFVSQDEGTLKLNGTGNQEITLGTAAEIPSLEIANTGSQSVDLVDNSVLTVAENLILADGDLNTTGGTLILESADATHAFILYGDGEITGDVRAERELDGVGDWFFLSNPMGTSYDEFLRTGGENQLWIQGVSGSNVPDASRGNTNLFTFNEEKQVPVLGGGETDSWETPSGMGQGSRGKGFILFPFADDNNDGNPDGNDKVIDNLANPQTSGSFTFSLTATDWDGNSGIGTDEGWNLLGNPYLTYLDWTKFGVGGSSGGITSNLSETVYVVEPGGGYKSFNGTKDGTVNDPVTFERDGIIGPFQAFFVKATGPDPELEITDITAVQTDAVNSDGDFNDAFLKSQENNGTIISLDLELQETTTNTRFTFRPDGARGMDRADAYELNPPFQNREVLELYTLLGDGTGLSINNLPDDLGQAVEIPLAASAAGCDGSQPFGGEATMTWPNITRLPDSWSMELVDTQTGETVNLLTQSDYTFTLDSETNPSQCTTSKAKSQGAAQEVPSIPTPEVTRHPSAKNGEVSTRFTLRIEPNTAIPVEFTSFTGSVADNAAKLEWTTATEQNNAGFQVQRKVDGSFQNIDGAFVEGAGTAEEPQSYSYRVEDLDAGQHTFRLKQVDVDGGSSFSKETTVKVGLDSQYELQAYPNPISEQATIKFAVKESQDVTLELYNTLGQRVQVLHQGAVPSSQTRTVSLQASDLSSGLYIVRMRGESFSTTKSVTVVR